MEVAQEDLEAALAVMWHSVVLLLSHHRRLADLETTAAHQQFQEFRFQQVGEAYVVTFDCNNIFNWL